MKPISLIHRLKSLGKSLLLGSALLLSHGQQATAQTFTNAIVDYGDGTSIPHGVLKTHTDGSVYAIWRDGSNSSGTGVPAEYKLIKWDETTDTWGTPIRNIVYNNIPGLLTGFGPGEHTDLAIDSAGGFHVIMTVPLSSPATGNGVVYAYSPAGAANNWTYSTVVNYTGDNNTPSYVSLELDSADKPHIFLLQRNIGSAGGPPWTARNFTARHFSSTNGTTWTMEEIYNQNGGSGTSVNEIAEIATTMDSNDKIHMLLSVENTGNNMRNITYATNASGSWVNTVIVPTSTTTQTHDIDLVVDSNNKVHALYSPITDRVVHYLTNRSGSWVDTTINSGAVTGRLGATSKRGLSINSANDLFFVYNSSPTSSNAGNVSYGFLPAATGNTWQTGSVMNGNMRTADTITTTITDTGRALTLFEHFTDPKGTGSPNNSAPPNTNSRQLQYATTTFVVADTTAPDTSISDGPSGPTNDTTPTFTFSGTDNTAVTSYEVQIDSGGWATATSPYTTGTLAQGSHTFYVRAKDAAGNTDATPAFRTFFVDTTAPDTSITANPATNSNSTSATFSFTGSDGSGSGIASFQLKLDTASFALATSPVTLTGLSQGSHTVEIRARDNAGNVDATPVSFTWTVDTVAPETTLVSAPATFTNNTTATFNFSSNESPVSYEMSTNGTDYFATFSSPITFSNVGQGTRTFTFRAKDSAGNVDPTPVSHTWTVDTTPPAAPVTVAPANGSTTNDNTPTYSGTAEAGSTVAVIVDGSFIGTTTATGGSWTFTQATPLADGSHTVYATATDAAGNTSGNSSTNTFTVDATPPPAPVALTPANGSRTSDNTPTYTGTAEAGSTVSVIVDGTPVGNATVTGGNWTYTPGTPLADGSHTVRATVTDSAGNTSPTSNTNTFTVDTTPPPAPVVTVPANGSTTNDSTPTISGTAETSSTVTVIVDGSEVANVPADSSGNWTYTLGTAIADGPHTARAIASDSVGNSGPSSNTNTFTVDTQPPTAPVVTAPTQNSRTNDNTPTFTGTTETGTTVNVIVDGSSIGTATVIGTNWTFTPTVPLADNPHSVKAQATDIAGNTSGDSNTRTFTVDTAKPSVVVSTSVTNPVPYAPFTVTMTFSEPVTGFDAGDVLSINGTFSDLTTSDNITYTATVTPSAPGVAYFLYVVAGGVQDLASNTNTVSNTLNLQVVDRAVLIVADASSVTEGNGSGTTPYGFTVSRVGGTVGAVNISYAVTGSGAAPANAADFGGTLPSGTVTIPDGQASVSLPINISRDTTVEANEQFTVTLSNPDNSYVLSGATATGTITNDDTATLTVEALNNGAEYPKVDGKFRVNLSAPSSNPTTVAVTFGGNATAGTDYTAPASTATIAAGETSVEIVIPVITDYEVELSQSVSVLLSSIQSGLPGITIGTPASANLGIGDNGPAAIVVNAGNSQSAVVGTAFATPLSVRVNDSQGNALSNAQVTFSTPATGVSGTFGGTTMVFTNASGIATAPAFTAATTTGSYQIRAVVTGTSIETFFSLTNIPAVATNFVVTIPATATAGTPVTATVTARDQYDNTATGYTGTVHLTSSDGAATLGADATVTNGTGTFSVTFATGGSQTVTATDTVSSAITGTSSASTVSPRADVSVTLTDSPDPVQAGENITYTVVLRNNGPSHSEAVGFSLPLPEGVTFVSAAQDSSGGAPNGWGNTITTPAVGSAGTVTISPDGGMGLAQYNYVIVGKVGYVGNGTVLSATATATSTTTDLNSANNSATATTTVSAAPEIALHNGASTIDAPITDGQATAINFGTTTVNNPVIRSFTIANTGNDVLSLTNIALPGGFSLVNPFSPPLQGFIFPGNSYTFQVRYDAATIGTASGDLVIANNDANESPFNFPITATRENVAPVAVTQDLTIEEDEVKEIVLTGNDADGQPITFTIVDQPQHGTLTGTAPNVTYTPNADYNGTDVFTFKVNDGTVDSAEKEINLTITPVNDAPKVVGTGIPDQIQIKPDVSRTIDLAPYFSDAETASANLIYTVQAPAEAQAVVTGSSLQINGSASGAYDITINAADSDTLNVSDTFTLTVKRVPQLAGNGVPPTLVSPSAPTFDLDLAGYFTDGDGDSLSYVITNNTDEGVFTATVTGSTVTITPVSPGVASLTVRVTDTDGNFIDHTFEITVDNPVPDAVPTVTSPPKLNRQTGLYEITLTATNNNQFNVPGFRFRVTSAMPSHIRLYNSTAPVGSSEPYLDVLNVLTPGQSITIVLEFHSTTRNFTGFNPTIVAEPLPEGTSNAATGEGMEINRFVNLADGSKLIEFSSIAGRWYEIQYSSDMITWKRSLVPVQAGANFTQWIDRGAPYTESHPSTVPSRFYRVSEILPN